MARAGTEKDPRWFTRLEYPVERIVRLRETDVVLSNDQVLFAGGQVGGAARESDYNLGVTLSPSYPNPNSYVRFEVPLELASEAPADPFGTSQGFRTNSGVLSDPTFDGITKIPDVISDAFPIFRKIGGQAAIAWSELHEGVFRRADAKKHYILRVEMKDGEMMYYPHETVVVLVESITEEHYTYEGRSLHLSVPILNTATVVEGPEPNTVVARDVVYYWRQFRNNPLELEKGLTLLNKNIKVFYDACILGGRSVQTALREQSRPAEGFESSRLTSALLGLDIAPNGSLAEDYALPAIAPAYRSWAAVSQRIRAAYTAGGFLTEAAFGAALDSLVDGLTVQLLRGYVGGSAVSVIGTGEGSRAISIRRLSADSTVGLYECLAFIPDDPTNDMLAAKLGRKGVSELRAGRAMRTLGRFRVNSAALAPAAISKENRLYVDQAEALKRGAALIQLEEIIPTDPAHTLSLVGLTNARAARPTDNVVWYLKTLRGATIRPTTDRGAFVNQALEETTRQYLELGRRALGTEIQAMNSERGGAFTVRVQGIDAVFDYLRNEAKNGGDQMSVMLLAFLEENPQKLSLDGKASENPAYGGDVSASIAEALRRPALVPRGAGWNAETVARPLLGGFILTFTERPIPGPPDFAAENAAVGEAITVLRANATRYAPVVSRLLSYRYSINRLLRKLIVNKPIDFYRTVAGGAERLFAGVRTDTTPGAAVVDDVETFYSVIPSEDLRRATIANIMDPITSRAFFGWLELCYTSYPDSSETHRKLMRLKPAELVEAFISEPHNRSAIVELVDFMMLSDERYRRLQEISDIRTLLDVAPSFVGVLEAVRPEPLSARHSSLWSITRALGGVPRLEGESASAYEYRLKVAQQMGANFNELEEFMNTHGGANLGVRVSNARVLAYYIARIITNLPVARYQLSEEERRTLDTFFIVRTPPVDFPVDGGNPLVGAEYVLEIEKPREEPRRFRKPTERPISSAYTETSERAGGFDFAPTNDETLGGSRTPSTSDAFVLDTGSRFNYVPPSGAAILPVLELDAVRYGVVKRLQDAVRSALSSYVTPFQEQLSKHKVFIALIIGFLPGLPTGIGDFYFDTGSMAVKYVRDAAKEPTVIFRSAGREDIHASEPLVAALALYTFNGDRAEDETDASYARRAIVNYFNASVEDFYSDALISGFSTKEEAAKTLTQLIAAVLDPGNAVYSQSPAFVAQFNVVLTENDPTGEGARALEAYRRDMGLLWGSLKRHPLKALRARLNELGRDKNSREFSETLEKIAVEIATREETLEEELDELLNVGEVVERGLANLRPDRVVRELFRIVAGVVSDPSEPFAKVKSTIADTIAFARLSDEELTSRAAQIRASPPPPRAAADATQSARLSAQLTALSKSSPVDISSPGEVDAFSSGDPLLQLRAVITTDENIAAILSATHTELARQGRTLEALVFGCADAEFRTSAVALVSAQLVRRLDVLESVVGGIRGTADPTGFAVAKERVRRAVFEAFEAAGATAENMAKAAVSTQEFLERASDPSLTPQALSMLAFGDISTSSLWRAGAHLEDMRTLSDVLAAITKEMCIATTPWAEMAPLQRYPVVRHSSLRPRSVTALENMVGWSSDPNGHLARTAARLRSVEGEFTTRERLSFYDEMWAIAQDGMGLPLGRLTQLALLRGMNLVPLPHTTANGKAWPYSAFVSKAAWVRYVIQALELATQAIAEGLSAFASIRHPAILRSFENTVARKYGVQVSATDDASLAALSADERKLLEVLRSNYSAVFEGSLGIDTDLGRLQDEILGTGGSKESILLPPAEVTNMKRVGLSVYRKAVVDERSGELTPEFMACVAELFDCSGSSFANSVAMQANSAKRSADLSVKEVRPILQVLVSEDQSWASVAFADASRAMLLSSGVAKCFARDASGQSYALEDPRDTTLERTVQVKDVSVAPLGPADLAQLVGEEATILAPTNALTLEFAKTSADIVAMRRDLDIYDIRRSYEHLAWLVSALFATVQTKIFERRKAHIRDQLPAELSGLEAARLYESHVRSSHADLIDVVMPALRTTIPDKKQLKTLIGAAIAKASSNLTSARNEPLAEIRAVVSTVAEFQESQRGVMLKAARKVIETNPWD